MAQINEKLEKLLKEVGEVVDLKDRSSAVWSLPQNQSVMIVKHKALEKISAHLGMWFDAPKIIESDTEKKIVSLVVQGYIDDGKGKNTAWSIGEVSPDNYKTYAKQSSYPYAMAEKRAIDRVILKLLGVHGDFYSQAEIDELEEGKEIKTKKPPRENKTPKEELQDLAEKDENIKEVLKHFPDAELVKYFGETKYLVALDENEQRIDTEEDLISSTKGFIKEMYNFNYEKSLELYNKNEELFLIYKEKNENGYKELMKWIGENTKKESA